jgi:dolichyl-phosphate-mannose--protein O-mannosyl transferase
LNDNWLVQRHSYTNHYDNSGYWLANDAITLRHIQTGATLHSHSIMLDNDDNQEVTCYGPGHEENDKVRYYYSGLFCNCYIKYIHFSSNKLVEGRTY